MIFFHHFNILLFFCLLPELFHYFHFSLCLKRFFFANEQIKVAYLHEFVMHIEDVMIAVIRQICDISVYVGFFH